MADYITPRYSKKRISFEFAFWIFFGITTFLFILDRFTTNVWPRQAFSTPNYKAGSDSFEMKKGPWSVVAYDFIAKLSGRYSIAALNGLFFTMMKTTHAFLSNSWISREYIDFSDTNARVRIHKYLGWSMAVLILLHVWSILFPWLFSGYQVVVKAGTFDWPLSERKPAGFKDVKVDEKLVMMQVDDVYRLILMSIIMGPLLYWSYKLISKNYRIGIQLHLFIAIMFFIDIVRRHTHPHCWVLNVPVFMFWVLDRIWGLFYLKDELEMEKIQIGPNYIFMYWSTSEEGATAKQLYDNDSIGKIMFLRAPMKHCESNCFRRIERSHPFTLLTNRGSILQPLVKEDISKKSDSRILYVSDGKLIFNSNKVEECTAIKDAYAKMKQPDKSEESGWTCGLLVKVYGKKKSHTKLIVNNFEDDEERGNTTVALVSWGCFNMCSIADFFHNNENIVCIGGGSGAAYLLDTVSYVCYHFGTHKTSKLVNDAPEEPLPAGMGSLLVRMFFTTNDIDLLLWFVNTMDRIVGTSSADCFHVRVSLTGGKRAATIKEFENKGSSINLSWGKLTLGRINFADELSEVAKINGEKGTHVFCQGGGKLQNSVRLSCSRYKEMTYHGSHSFGN